MGGEGRGGVGWGGWVGGWAGNIGGGGIHLADTFFSLQ